MRIKFWEADNVSWHGVWYRLVMRIAHKYHWHYMPPLPVIHSDGKVLYRCDWCGIRQTINDGKDKVARNEYNYC
jgi:hypothetical protein